MPQLITLNVMRQIVRQMSGRYTPQQMTTQQIDSFINRAYTLHMPLDFKNAKLTKAYVFNTVPNVDTYPFVYENNIAVDGAGNDIPGNIELSPPAYCQGYLLNYFQDKTLFYNLWPKLTVNQQLGTGNGIVGFPYTGTIPNNPFLRAQKDIQGNITEPAVIISGFNDTGFSFALTDQPVDGSNTGLLVGEDGVNYGFVNYLNGQFSFNFLIPAGTIYYASVVPYQAARPISTLFYQQQIVLRPVPAQVFQIEFQISQQPTQLIASGDAPELDEWYLFICAWAAKLIYTQFPDPQGMAELKPTWEEQCAYAQRRTLRQMSSQRVNTIFSTPGNNYRGWAYGAEFSGGP